ncbi:MAG: OmpA family protein [Paludibacteraceae bacterium]|nr:OmpA family protein [Paludibacteraceae bacterium]
MKRITSILLAIFCSISLFAAETTDSVNTPLRYDTGSFLHFGIGGGLGQLGYSLQGGNTTTFMPSFTAGIQYTYYFLPWLGLGAGLHVSYYTSQANLTDQMAWPGQTDTEGDSYTHRVDFNQWRERQNDIMLEIPILLSFKVKPNKGGFYFNIGAKAGIPVYADYVHNRGDLIHSGYYPEWDVVMSGLPGRFETEPLPRAQDGSIYNKVRKVNAAGFAELGALIQLDPLTDLTLGVYANYYISNHSTVKSEEATDLGFRNADYNTDFMNPYEGLVGTKHIGAMHPWSVGLKIGLQTHLRTKEERNVAKARKAAQQQQQLAAKNDTILLTDTLVLYDTIKVVVHDTIFIRDTLYMTVRDTVIGNKTAKDTTWIVRIDTICPDPQHPGNYINITEERLQREDDEMEKEAERQQQQQATGGKQQQSRPVITENGKRAARKLDGKLTTSVIWFHFDDYKPILEPFDVIDTVAQALLADPDLLVNINGHACKIGKDSYNQRLAMKRAQAVARLLRLKGVPAKQMTVRSLGAHEPYRYNGEHHQYSKDRRVEIVPIGTEDEHTSVSGKQKTETQPATDVNTSPHRKRTDVNYRKYKSFIGEEKVKQGSRLAQIARRWYGHQEYWVYIYEANADKIKNPSLIYPGMVLMIPDLEGIIDTSDDSQALQAANNHARQYGYNEEGEKQTEQPKQTTQPAQTQQPKQTEQPKQTTQPAQTQQPKQTEQPKQTTQPAQTQQTAQTSTSPQTKYKNFVGEQKVTKGKTLQQIADEWYGRKEYWVYIYEANFDKIKDPKALPAGITLKIPDLFDFIKNYSEKQAVENAIELAEQYE